ncbi:MAG: mucoidy inhibitor MuiA family protein [Candidatus Omnitrophica bacterium]|nr:mucoidy inhibitor MuiA family protein [Candidatus Omnitrophota bacterium]
MIKTRFTFYRIFIIGVMTFVVSSDFFSGKLLAETLEAPSKIADVTVFPDRALVTRRVQLDLAKGMHEVRIGSLPPTLEEDSLAAKGKGEAKVTLFGARLVTTQLEVPQPARIREIAEELKKLKDREQALKDRKAVLNEKREFLASIKAASTEQIGKEIVTQHPSIADVAELLNLLDRELSSVYLENEKADIELRDLGEQMDRLNREWNELSGGWRKAETAILVDLEAEEAGSFTLEVSYRLLGATWEPLYEARAHSEGTEIELTAYGLVKQNTGEDWQDVTLHLSTAKPSIAGRMPEIEPWFLKKWEPAYFQAKAASLSIEEKSGMKRQALREAALNTMMAPSTAAPVEAEIAKATVEAKGPALFFTLPKSETVNSDWQPKKVAITSHALQAALAFEISPRLAPYAYLRAKVKNSSEGLLPRGKVQIFLDGSYVGSSFLKNVGPAEEFDLFLGIDERIKVERKELKAKVDVSVLPGLHGRIKTIQYEYLTKIENFRTSESEITLFDQTPISQHDEIKIEQVVFDPKPTEEDQEKPGIYRWKLKLAPRAKQEIKISYLVKHPVDFEISGL